MSLDAQGMREQAARHEAAALVSGGPELHGWRRVAWALRRDGPVWIVAALTLFNGMLGILTISLTRVGRYPRWFDLPLPYGLHHWGRTLNLIFGFALIYLSFHLWRRRRSAWVLAMIGSMLTTLAHLGRGQLAYTAIAPAITVVLLALWRYRYTVRSEVDSIRFGVTLFVVSLLVALAYGTLGFWLLERRDFGLNFHLGDALLRTIREFTLIDLGISFYTHPVCHGIFFWLIFRAPFSLIPCEIRLSHSRMVFFGCAENRF